jgi:hypothetical protein
MREREREIERERESKSLVFENTISKFFPVRIMKSPVLSDDFERTSQRCTSKTTYSSLHIHFDVTLFQFFVGLYERVKRTRNDVEEVFR